MSPHELTVRIAMNLYVKRCQLYTAIIIIIIIIIITITITTHPSRNVRHDSNVSFPSNAPAPHYPSLPISNLPHKPISLINQAR
jgi:hypothetical protein